ncbi:hypothetical protein F4777DRAFT_126196 [Nemania sp. FL0916]|nr:hypothetical protein F4777DRAFT_126196 [Nemania sp. FL0916]
MYFTPAFLAIVLATAASAGNVCLAGKYEVSKFDFNHPLYLFAAGHACEDGNTLEWGDDKTVETACDVLPLPVHICDKDANLVATDKGPDNQTGCKIGLEIDGTVYEASEDYPFNPDDGNANNGPCDADCGLSTGIDGFLQFIGVPMCNLG